MPGFNSIKGERLFNQSLSLFIPTNVSDEEFEYLIKQAECIDKMKQELVKKEVSFEDYLDAVEYFGVNIDEYCKEVETNLNHAINDLYR